MSTNGMLDYCLAQGGVDATEFKEFVKRCLLMHLMSFDGITHMVLSLWDLVCFPLIL